TRPQNDRRSPRRARRQAGCTLEKMWAFLALCGSCSSVFRKYASNGAGGETTRTAERRGRRNDADGGTTRTAERRGRRNDADGGTTRTAERRGRRNDADGG